jgi:hypothetical protein
MVNNYTREMNTISAIVDVRQKNGEEYEPSYLRGFERHRKRKNYGISVIEHAVVLSDLFGKELHANGILSCSWKSLNISSNMTSSIPFANSCFAQFVIVPSK